MIPAAIQAPQAVAETINSFCPPGLSVAPVGTTITLYRGASKTPFASFAYTGPDSVLGIVVATWRIALADHGQPVTNITNVSPDVEKMKALVDALEILGWSHALEPTAFARSYLVIEQQTLAEAREAAAQAESRVRALESESADRLDALSILGYHPDMNLGEWTEARVKQRDATESRVRVLEGEVAALRDSEQRAVDASVDAREALKSLGWDEVQHPIRVWARQRADLLAKGLREARDMADQGTTQIVELRADLDTIRSALLAAKGFENSTRTTAQLAEDVAARLKATGDEMQHQRDRAAKHESDIGVITQAYFAAGFGPSPATPGGIASALDKARRRGDALRALGWDGLVDPETWARHCPTENETLAQIRGAILEALGLAKQGTGRPIIELLGELVDARDKARHYADRARMNLDDAKKWEVRVLDGFRALAFSVDPALIWPHPATLPTSMEIKALCDRAESARKGCPADKAPIGEVTARYESPDASPVDKEAPREPSLRTRWMAFQDAAVALGLSTHIGPDGGVVVTIPSRFAKPATIGVRLALDPGEGVDVARVLNTPIEPRRVVGVDHATGESVTCMRVSLPGGTQVRYLIHDGKEWVEAPARTIGSREAVGPRWTGITWMSAKGRAKTCRIEGLTFSVSKLASADPAPTVIKVPTSPWNLPAKLVRRIHGKKTLSFHVGGGKVITGTVAKVDASAISSMLLYVAT